MKDEHLSLRTRYKQELTLVFLSASLLGIMATSVLSAGSDAVAQAITSLDTIKKKRYIQSNYDHTRIRP
jgi:hypothetical protein